MLGLKLKGKTRIAEALYPSNIRITSSYLDNKFIEKKRIK